MLVSFFATVTGNQGLIWDWGDGTQSSTLAASISHQYPTTNLNYTITLKAFNECGDTVTTVRTLNEIGFPENNLADIRLHPNPTTNSPVQVEFTKITSGSYQLLDPSGKSIQYATFENCSSIIIPVQDLASGTYVLRLHTLTGTYNQLLFKI